MCNYNISPSRELSVTFGPEDSEDFQDRVIYAVDLFLPNRENGDPQDLPKRPKPENGVLSCELAQDTNPELVTAMLQNMGIHPDTNSVK